MAQTLLFDTILCHGLGKRTPWEGTSEKKGCGFQLGKSVAHGEIEVWCHWLRSCQVWLREHFACKSPSFFFTLLKLICYCFLISLLFPLNCSYFNPWFFNFSHNSQLHPWSRKWEEKWGSKWLASHLGESRERPWQQLINSTQATLIFCVSVSPRSLHFLGGYVKEYSQLVMLVLLNTAEPTVSPRCCHL